MDKDVGIVSVTVLDLLPGLYFVSDIGLKTFYSICLSNAAVLEYLFLGSVQ